MGEGTRLLLARHGEVADDWRERIYGDLDVPLSPRGEEQARRFAARIAVQRLDAVVSTGLARTDFGAACIRARLPPGDPARAEHVDPRLRELRRGAWAGLGRAELEARAPGAWEAFWSRGGVDPPPGGESLEELASRVLPALDDWARRCPGGRVAIVAHKWVLRVAVAAARELPLARSASLEIPVASLTVVDWPAGGRRPGGPRPRLFVCGVDPPGAAFE